uniref:Uncharacterized protein n=1 Tax=Cyprinus carpio TaxID=7962 RepID=A0A8C2CN06_CYPCA
DDDEWFGVITGDSSSDADLSSVMGFSGFGKKARTFDLEAMFEQTRRTAIERSQRILGHYSLISPLLRSLKNSADSEFFCHRGA